MMKTSISLITLVALFANVDAFSTPPRCSKITNGHSPTEICMVKKIKNKQLEMAKKMEIAKQQAAQKGFEATGAEIKLSAEEMKKENDRKRFEELLSRQPVGMSDLSADNYLTKDQEEFDMDLRKSGKDLLFEGDPAPTDEFKSLIPTSMDPTTVDKPLGEMGAKRLIPWMRDGSGSDFLVVICDPRVQSIQLRDIAKSLSLELPQKLLKDTIVISADSSAENRRFLKKSKISNLDMFSDESKDWMKAYTAIGSNRLYATMFIVAEGRIQKIARDLDPLDVIKTIQNAVKAYKARSL